MMRSMNRKRERVLRAAWHEAHRRRMSRCRDNVPRGEPRKHLGPGRTVVSMKSASGSHRYA